MATPPCTMLSLRNVMILLLSYWKGVRTWVCPITMVSTLFNTLHYVETQGMMTVIFSCHLRHVHDIVVRLSSLTSCSRYSTETFLTDVVFTILFWRFPHWRHVHDIVLRLSSLTSCSRYCSETYLTDVMLTVLFWGFPHWRHVRDIVLWLSSLTSFWRYYSKAFLTYIMFTIFFWGFPHWLAFTMLLRGSSHWRRFYDVALRLFSLTWWKENFESVCLRLCFKGAFQKQICLWLHRFLLFRKLGKPVFWERINTWWQDNRN